MVITFGLVLFGFAVTVGMVAVWRWWTGDKVRW